MGEKESSPELLSVQGVEADQDALSLVADYEEKHKSGLINLLESFKGICKFQMLCKLVCMIILYRIHK